MDMRRMITDADREEISRGIAEQLPLLRLLPVGERRRGATMGV